MRAMVFLCSKKIICNEGITTQCLCLTGFWRRESRGAWATVAGKGTEVHESQGSHVRPLQQRTCENVDRQGRFWRLKTFCKLHFLLSILACIRTDKQASEIELKLISEMMLHGGCGSLQLWKYLFPEPFLQVWCTAERYIQSGLLLC